MTKTWNKYKQTTGSKAQVFHGTAKHTPGGVFKDGIKQKRNGRLVFLKASRSARRTKNLWKSGFTAKKGKFGSVRRKNF